MVSKRQREAKKRFRESNPELLVKPEPKPCKDPIKTKKKLAKLKRKLAAPNKDETKTKKSIRSSSKKHPLRMVKPGESCFICKGNDHIAKYCPEKAQWEKNKICLFCRARGHSLKACPKKIDDSTDQKLCYNCGETGHSLDRCHQPRQDGGTSFASCFICNQQGHLSKNCPQNTHGIYPKGGSCKICGGITHLARDCPEKGMDHRNAASVSSNAFKITDEPTGQVTRFMSGDDLEDDFTTVDKEVDAGKSKKSSESRGFESGSNENGAKVKKSGPKVVNFVG